MWLPDTKIYQECSYTACRQIIITAFSKILKLVVSNSFFSIEPLCSGLSYHSNTERFCLHRACLLSGWATMSGSLLDLKNTATRYHIGSWIKVLLSFDRTEEATRWHYDIFWIYNLTSSSRYHDTLYFYMFRSCQPA